VHIERERRRRGPLGGLSVRGAAELRVALLLRDTLAWRGQPTRILVSLVMRVAPVSFSLRDHKRRSRQRLSPRVGSTAAQDEPDWKKCAAARRVWKGGGGAMQARVPEMAWWRGCCESAPAQAEGTAKARATTGGDAAQPAHQQNDSDFSRQQLIKWYKHAAFVLHLDRLPDGASQSPLPQ
jgi:hypothetical protein